MPSAQSVGFGTKDGAHEQARVPPKRDTHGQEQSDTEKNWKYKPTVLNQVALASR